MKNSPRFALCALLAGSLALAVAGCKSSSDQAANQAGVTNDAQDPAAANLADVSAAPAPAPAKSASQSASTPAPAQSAPVRNAVYEPEQVEADEIPEAYAPQPPPELVEYQQPVCPDEGYIWTPGYWHYQPTGYYWVPGVWVRAPFEGALWTPGYWAYRGNRYVFFRGHWGRHIGYYGGINYGFGYFGTGYEGGYWRGHDFAYNRAVNNVNTTVVRNVYEYKVTNIRNITNVTRVSYNGGPSGIQARAQAPEFIEHREPRALPMVTQQQHQHQAQLDRKQFIAPGQAHPGRIVAERGLEADRDVRPVPREQLPHLAPAPGMAQPGRPGTIQHGPVQAPRRPQDNGKAHPDNRNPHPDNRKPNPGEPR